MSFLFGKKKPGSRDVGSANAPANAPREKDKPAGAVPQTTTGSSVNNSLNSLGGASPDHGRTRLDQEAQVRSINPLPSMPSPAQLQLQLHLVMI